MRNFLHPTLDNLKIGVSYERRNKKPEIGSARRHPCRRFVKDTESSRLLGYLFCGRNNSLLLCLNRRGDW
jgi:hypothetical protein